MGWGGGILGIQWENAQWGEAHSLPGTPHRDLTRTQGVWLQISPLPSLLPPVPPPAHSVPPSWSELAMASDLQVSPPVLPWSGPFPHPHPSRPLFPQPGNPALAPGLAPWNTLFLLCSAQLLLTLPAFLSVSQVGAPMESRTLQQHLLHRS